MASTSTQLQEDGASFPSGSSSRKYDVFMSFRGTDTRDGFVEHLYSALYEHVIFTFKDNQWLERGESISLALVKAIEESRLAVVVFSENYASSKWCLEELVKILECQKKRALAVLPVFYKVDPSDLRKQRGSVGEAFAQHERDSSEEKVQGWRNALTEAADISGWDSKTQGPEAKLVRDIAINILNRLSLWNGRMGLDKLKYVDFSYSPCITKNIDFTHGEAFVQLERDSTEEEEKQKVQRWRNALTEAANSSGWHLETYGPEAKLDRDIATDILNRLGYNGATDILNRIGYNGSSDGSRYICGSELPTKLNVHGCSKLSKLLEYLGLERLEFISMKDCKELTSLPSGICGLKLLRVLNVPGCSNLTNLPSGICGLKFLTELNVFGCSKLSSKLPGNLGGLERLEFTSTKDCKELTSLPCGISGLKLLRELNVSGCSKLSVLLENLERLERLRSCLEQPWNEIMCPDNLSLDNLSRYTTMKLDFTQVANLKELILDSNFSEGFLPDDLGSLSWLEYLDLSGTNIINLPTSIRDLYELQYLDLRNCKKLETLPYLPTNNIIAVNGCTSLETLTDPAIFPRQLDDSFTNCHTLIKNRPSLLEFLRNILKNNKESHIVVPEREIPKYVGVQLSPDWYQRLRGFVVCAVFEEMAPSIDDERYAECYVMWNDDVVYSTRIYIGSVQFQSDPLFLHYMALHDWVGEIRRRAEVNDLKKNEIVFYFGRSSPEIVDIVAPVKCAVHIVYENDEWSDSHLSFQQSDYDEKKKSPGL